MWIVRNLYLIFAYTVLNFRHMQSGRCIISYFIVCIVVSAITMILLPAMYYLYHENLRTESVIRNRTRKWQRSDILIGICSKA